MRCVELQIKLNPLTKDAFAEFGEVIQIQDAPNHFSINEGTFERYYDLANIDIGPDTNGRPVMSIAHCKQATELPCPIPLLERHPLGSQAIYPLFETPMIVVVAPRGEQVDPNSIKAFITKGGQGINYHIGTWHLPIIALKTGQQFLLFDRGGPEKNCDLHYFPEEQQITLLPPA